MKDKNIGVVSNDDTVNVMVQEIKKLDYMKPQLTCFGDVRDVTLGGSISGGESLGGCIVGLEPGCNP